MTILDDIEVVLKHEIDIAEKRLKEAQERLNEEDADEEYRRTNEVRMNYFAGREEAFKEALAIVKGGYDRS